MFTQSVQSTGLVSDLREDGRKAIVEEKKLWRYL